MMWHDATEHPPVVGKLRRRVDERPSVVGEYVEIDDALLRRAGNMVRAETRQEAAPPPLDAFVRMHADVTSKNDAEMSGARAQAVAERERQISQKLMKLRGKVNTLTKGLRGVSEKLGTTFGSQATAEKLALTCRQQRSS